MNQFTLKMEKQEGKYNQVVKKIALVLLTRSSVL